MVAVCFVAGLGTPPNWDSAEGYAKKGDIFCRAFYGLMSFEKQQTEAVEGRCGV